MADFGPWPRIADESDARLAVRMAGLPVFLIGLSAVSAFGSLLLWTIGSGLGLNLQWPFIVGLTVAMALIGLGFAIRAGRARFVPLAALLTFAHVAITLNTPPIIWGLSFQVLMLLVAVSVLRGWWWLRKRGV